MRCSWCWPLERDWIPPNYDVTADGLKFLVNVAEESGAAVPITLMVNWTAELRKH